MPQHVGLVDLGLAGPALLVERMEDLDGDCLPPPFSAPDFAVTTFADDHLGLNLTRNSPLDEERQTWRRGAQRSRV